MYIQEGLKNSGFILISCSFSEISGNDHSTCIPLSVKWDVPVYGSSDYDLRSRLCSIRPNNSRLLGMNYFAGDSVSLYIAKS